MNVSDIEKLKKILSEEIKDTKTLKTLDFDYVFQKLEKFILTNGDVFKKLRIVTQKKGFENIRRNKVFKEIVKRVRDELRVVYGSFLTQDFSKRKQFLSSVKDEDGLFDILRVHKSTRERIDFYDEIYSKIFEWYKPRKIGDLACGLNPLSYFVMLKYVSEELKYFASDLSCEDMDFLNLFFDKFGVKGVAKAYDVTNLSVLEDEDFQECDLVFLFKALDSFEEVKKNVSKDIVKGIRAKHIVVSFPTKSLVSKKQFRLERRNWFFNFLDKEGFDYEQFEVENEMFVLIRKS